MDSGRVTYTRCNHVEWMIGVDGRITVKDLESNWFFPLNEVASLIWDLMDGTYTITEMVDYICSEYDAQPTTVKSDVSDFVEQALDLNLVEEQLNRH